MNPLKNFSENAPATGTADILSAGLVSLCPQEVVAPSRWRVIALIATMLAFIPACSKHDDHDHAHHDHKHDHPEKESPAKPDAHDDHTGHSHGAPESTNVTYNEKTGLTFDPATAQAINLTTTRIATRPLAHRITLNATVINATPPIQVTALVPPAVADDMEAHPHDGVRRLAVNRALTHATAQVEVTLALADVAQAAKPASSPAIGDTLAIPLTGPSESKLTLPNTAILRTVAGTFAYLRAPATNTYLRTPITLGVTDGTHTEILTGLTANDEVAATAVEQLWLTELRLTKGGGHSH